MVIKHPMSRHEIALRDDLIKVIPRRPNSRESHQAIRGLDTASIFIIYLTWRSRFVMARPRRIEFWTPVIDEARLLEINHGFKVFLEKVTRGEDLTPHLSELVKSNGYVMGSPKDGDASKVREDDKDMILIRTGFHHFHVGVPDAGNPKGRSKFIIFAKVSDENFTVISICSHEAFDRKTDEFRRFMHGSDSYVQRNMSPGVLYMNNPVTASGHSDELADHAIYCLHQIRRHGDSIEDEVFVRKLFNERSIKPPKKLKLKWHFEHLDLCLKAPGEGAPIIMLPFSR